MKEVTELFDAIVLDIDSSIKIYSIESLSGNTTIKTCNTKWARKGKKISLELMDDSVLELKIASVINNEEIVVGGTHDIKSVMLLNPFKISGTKTSTNNEWNKADRDLTKKTPLIWLYPNYTEKVYGDEASLERTITMSIAFLDETNPKFQKNEEHIENAVIPMKNLVYEFIKSFNNKAIYKKLKDYSLKTYSRFGVETDSGIIQNILDADLAGVVLTVTLDKFKEPCKC